VIADTGMDGVSKVQGRCVAAKINDLALGGKDKYLVREQVRLGAIKELH